MFACYVDEKLLFSTTQINGREIISGSLTEEINSVSSLEFTLPPSNDMASRVYPHTSVIKLESDGVEIFRGTASSVIKNFRGDTVVSCDGMIALMADIIKEPFTVSPSESREIESYITAIVQNYNDGVAADKQIKVGQVSGFEGQTFSISHSNECKNIFELLKELRAEKGGYIWASYIGGDVRINYTKTIGKENRQKIAFGSNLVNIEDQLEVGTLVTRVWPIGTDGLTIESVNDGKAYLQNEEVELRYGRVDKTIQVDSDDPSVVKSYGQAYLTRYAAMNNTITLTAIDLHNLDKTISSFEVGDSVRVISPPHGIDAEMIVNSISTDLVQLSNSRITLGGKKGSITGVISSGVGSGGSGGFTGGGGSGFSPVISVTDFGAVGDGRTDDTKAIQNAIDSVAQTDGGGLVYFPTGVYLITKPLVLTTARIGTYAGTRYWDGNGVTMVGEHVAKTKIVKTGTAVYSGSETYADSKKQSFAQTPWDAVIIGTGEATGHRIENLTLENQSSAADTYTVVSWVSRMTLENINSVTTSHGINLYSYFNRLENIRFNGSSDVLHIDDGTSTFVSRTFVSSAQNPYYIKSAYSTLSNMAADGCTGSIYQVGGAGVVMIGCGAESPDAIYHIYCPVNDTVLTVVGGMFYGQTAANAALVAMSKNRCKVTLIHPCISIHANADAARYMVHTTKAANGIEFNCYDLSYQNASGYTFTEYGISDANPASGSFSVNGRPIDYLGNPLDWKIGESGAEFWDGDEYVPAVYRQITSTNYNVTPTLGKRLTADGEADYASMWITDYIPCTSGDVIYGKLYLNDSATQGLAMYDSNKNLLKYKAFRNITNAEYGVTYNGGTESASGANSLVIPVGDGTGWNANTAFIRLTGHNNLAPASCPFTVNEPPSGKISDFALRSEIPSLSGLQTKKITDSGNYFSTDTVDGALQEIGSTLNGVGTLLATL